MMACSTGQNGLDIKITLNERIRIIKNGLNEYIDQRKTISFFFNKKCKPTRIGIMIAKIIEMVILVLKDLIYIISRHLSVNDVSR